MHSVSIDAVDEFQTTDATPADRVLFEMTPQSSVNARVLVCCRRPSDGATKVWDLTTVTKLAAFEATAVNLANRDGLAFGLAGDLTALLTATIAFFASGRNIGLTLTGLLGTTLNWGIMLRGIQVNDV